MAGRPNQGRKEEGTDGRVDAVVVVARTFFVDVFADVAAVVVVVVAVAAVALRKKSVLRLPMQGRAGPGQHIIRQTGERYKNERCNSISIMAFKLKVENMQETYVDIIMQTTRTAPISARTPYIDMSTATRSKRNHPPPKKTDASIIY